MTTWFVSRHDGAMEWARQEGFTIDRLVAHLDMEQVQPGDSILGTLPVHLAAEVCRRGAHYLHLTLETAPEQRGTELTAEDMRQCGARLEEYQVQKVAEN